MRIEKINVIKSVVHSIKKTYPTENFVSANLHTEQIKPRLYFVTWCSRHPTNSALKLKTSHS